MIRGTLKAHAAEEGDEPKRWPTVDRLSRCIWDILQIYFRYIGDILKIYTNFYEYFIWILIFCWYILKVVNLEILKIFRNIIRRRWFSHTFTLEVTGTDICDTRIGSKHFTPMSSASNIYISRYFPFEYLLTFIPSKSTFYTPKVLFVFFTILLPTFILLLFSLCYFANFFLSFLKQQKN